MDPHDQHALRPGSKRRLHAVQRAFRALHGKRGWRALQRYTRRLGYWMLPALIGIGLAVVGATYFLDFGSAAEAARNPLDAPACCDTRELPPKMLAPPVRPVAARSCRELRAMGLAPAYRGQPGYAEHLDRDNDDIACEPYLTSQ